MKNANPINCLVVATGIIFSTIFIGFFVWFPSLEFSGPGPSRGMAAGMTFIFCYFILFVISLGLTIKNLVLIKKITKKWIKYFAFLPICLTIGTPLGFFLVEAMEPGIDAQCHKLIIELKSSAILKNGESELNTSGGSSARPLPTPRQDNNDYIYDFSELIFKESKRELILESDNCKASFILDIPEMPKEQSDSNWIEPTKKKAQKKILNFLLDIEL